LLENVIRQLHRLSSRRVSILATEGGACPNLASSTRCPLPRSGQ
jgi:hypothetical protein